MTNNYRPVSVLPYTCTAKLIANRFIHSFGHFYSAPSSPLLYRRRSRLQHGYCIGVSSRSAQATVGKGLAQGPYIAARVGVEPTTLPLKAIDSTKAPPLLYGQPQNSLLSTRSVFLLSLFVCYSCCVFQFFMVQL